MRKFSSIACALFVSLVGTAQAATFIITLDQDTALGNANGTTLTLRFATAIDGSTVFSGADFFDRTWANLNLFGPANLTNNVGLFPEQNLDNTDIVISGSVNATATPFNFGFSYAEVDASLGFTPIDFARITGNRLRGLALWTAIDGFFPNFYVDSVLYSATGTSADFTNAAAVPLPAALPFMLAGLGMFAGVKRQKSKASKA